MLISKPGLKLFMPNLEFCIHSRISYAALGKKHTLSEPWFIYYFSLQNLTVRKVGL